MPKVCQSCGEQNGDDAKTCGMCGLVLTTPAPTATPSTPTQAVPVPPRPAGMPIPPPPRPVERMQPQNTFTGYAGFWLRLVAHIIDQIVLGIVVLPISVGIGLVRIVTAVSAASQQAPDPAAFPGLQAMIQIGVVVMAWLYYACMESSPLQATLGKLALGLKVTDLYGARIGFGRATGRFFGKIISGLILAIGFILAGFTDKKQALHDMMASCLVVRK